MKPHSFIESLTRFLKKLIPSSLFRALQPTYHYILALVSTIVYRFPSRSIPVVAVTGTKGKSSVTEMVNHIFEEAGYKTALLNTIQIKVGDEVSRNMFKMSTPGRGFVQKFIRKAHNAGCDIVIMELTSQAVLLHRHRFIHLDSLIYTNISPEHIEAHGSFENYLEAKLKLADLLARSKKEGKSLVVNMDDKHASDFIERAGKDVTTLPYEINDGEPYVTRDDGTMFTFKGIHIHSILPGLFNIYNMLAASTLAFSFGISPEIIKVGLEKMKEIRGRLEKIDSDQDFDVYVDYAHTPDSLEKVYQAFNNRRKIGVLGNTGGGRDTWKRKVMAQIAETYCDHTILTNEDPYDEDPNSIAEEMYSAFENPEKASIVIDRREAIALALRKAEKGDVVLITGKGTDPYIMEADGKKTPWDDATVAEEELRKL